ncbi:PfkB family carbohydrate kinase [Aggregatilineales bacterium SYSU G02658]
MTPDLLLIGHATADLKPQGRVLGGTVSYAARIAQAFGLQPAIVTSADPSDPLVQSLSASVPLVEVVPAPETTTFENVYVGARRIQTLHGRARNLSIEDVPAAWRAAGLVHLAPLVDELNNDLYSAFRAPVMLTPQGLMRQWDAKGRVTFRRWFEPHLLRHVALAVFSQQDIEGDTSLIEAFRQVVMTVVTDGAAGGAVYRGTSVFTYPAYPAEEVDPTGAGDVFATSLLIAQYFLKLPLEEALSLAAQVAALTVQHTGVYTPTPDEISAIVAQYT